jgi:transcriptional regulator with XRE-family HTH domain
MKARRLELGLRQEDVAERADLSLRRFRTYETASLNFNPTFDTMVKFCDALETKLEVLLREPTKEEIARSRVRDTSRAFKKKT